MMEQNPTTTRKQIRLLAGNRQSIESDKAVIACNDWLRLGAGRNLPQLIEKYSGTKRDKAPTQSRATLTQWSMKFDWAERATAYDAKGEERENDVRAQAMETGLALDYERVNKLKRLADFLEGQIYEKGANGVYHNVWLPDVKQIGSGPLAERVDIEKFNAPILEQYRGTLDDLAKETGGRKTKVEATGAGGAPLNPPSLTVVIKNETGTLGEAGDGAANGSD